MKWLIVLALLGACRIDSLDVTGKPCPCPSGWICDPGSQTCQRSTSDQDSGVVDAMLTDAGFDLVTGLLYYYKFDQTSGQSIVDDSPTNRRGTACSAAQTAWVPGKVGNAMKFNGVGYMSYVMFPSPTSQSCTCGPHEPMTGSFTVSMWVMFDSFHGYNGYTLGDYAASYGSAGGNGGAWGLGALDACGGVTTAGISVTSPTNGRVNRCGNTALSAGTWYFLTGVYDAGARTLDIYLDGQKDNGGFTTNSPAVPSSLNLLPQDQCPYIAASANQNSLLFGSADEFRLYSRALTAAEVAELYRISQ